MDSFEKIAAVAVIVVSVVILFFLGTGVKIMVDCVWLGQNTSGSVKC